MPSLNTTPELFWLTATVVMTAVLWIPYIVNRIVENGLVPALRNPKPDTAPKAEWANRLIHAHMNSVENLVIFAPLVLSVSISGVSNPATITASMVYFFTRLAHTLIYTLGIPFLRTITFFIGFICQMTLAKSMLGL